jgi:hypothetical protein
VVAVKAPDKPGFLHLETDAEFLARISPLFPDGWSRSYITSLGSKELDDYVWAARLKQRKIIEVYP